MELVQIIQCSVLFDVQNSKKESVHQINMKAERKAYPETYNMLVGP
jgi:hypothetical protein